MSEFNYEKAYCVQALPAFEALNKKQKEAHAKLLPIIGELNQGRDLNIPFNVDFKGDKITTILDGLTCQELAEMSRASYFTGHWKPGLLKSPFDNSKGESWKVANVCDQILRSRLELPHNILIHEGKFRVTFSNKDCWMWDEFGLATEKNLDLFKNCALSFGENTIEKSAKVLAQVCGDLWPDVDTMPENETYKKLLELKKADNLKKLEKQHADKLQSIKDDIKASEIELAAFTWLINNHVDIENCIYYNHTGRFCFGWRTPIDSAKVPELSQKLIDFPFEYDIKHN
jgi:hypothetical protein